MYKKALIGGDFLYFVYAPPQTYLDFVNPHLPNPPYRGAPRELSSVYYYWWAFLRLNQSYIDCCANGGRGPLATLYKDFEDVRDPDFISWWKKHGAHCFAEPQQTEYVEVVTRQSAPSDAEHSVLISVPLAADIEQTMSSLRSTLTPLFQEHRLKHGHFSKARYKVTAKPVLISLDQILRAKQAKDAHPGLANRQLAEVAELSFGDVNARDGQDVDQLNSSRIHLWLKKADKLIENVAEGRFPDFSDPKKPKRVKKPLDPENF